MVSVIDATVSLTVQIVILVLLFVALNFKNKKKYRQHGITMTTAVLLHIITILTVMIPSFSFLFTSSPGTITIDAIVIISFIHVALGFIAVALGIWLAASWHLKTDMQRCFANKRIMKPTLALWVTAILLGVIMYVAFWAASLL
jgi:uncharacterized membrane protein YozB (DUF420 family)